MHPRDEGRKQRESTVVAWDGDRQVGDIADSNSHPALCWLSEDSRLQPAAEAEVQNKFKLKTMCNAEKDRGVTGVTEAEKRRAVNASVLS